MANSWNESGTTWSTGRWGTTDVISSGWGADDWNTGGSWGQATDELVSLTGVSATTSIGDVTSGANQGWGRAGWSEEPYGESNNPVVTLTGQLSTVSLGTTTESNQTGWGRLSWGIADWGEGRDETVSLTGIELTSSLGDITTENIIFLEMLSSNASMRSAVGSPQVDGEIGVPLTGVSAEFATPTLAYVGHTVGWGRNEWGEDSWGESPDEVITLVGRSMNASVSAANSWGEDSWNGSDVWGGSFDVTIETAYDLSSQVATTSVGSLSFVISPTVSLTGQAATSDEGLLGLAFGTSTEPVTGIALTSSLGTPGLEFGPSAITGVLATTSVGEITVGSVELINVTGVAATSGLGSITLEFAYELSGQSSTSAVGSITSPDVIQGLVLDQLTSTVGLLGIESYANIDTGSNTSYTSVATGSNSSYSNVAIGSNTSYNNVA